MNRDTHGKFAKLSKVKAFLIWYTQIFGKVAALYVALAGFGTLAVAVIPEDSAAPVEIQLFKEAEAGETFESKLEAVKWGVVDRLQKCESAGRKEMDGIVVIDNNMAGTLRGEDVFSYGPLQWKVKTVKQFVKSRDNKTITSKEAIMLALDGEEARNLAYHAIWETKGGIFHWQNCQAKLGLAGEIELVKKLTQ